MEPEEGRTMVTRRPHPLTWALVAVVLAVVVVLGVVVAGGDDGGEDSMSAADDETSRPPASTVPGFGEAEVIVFMDPAAAGGDDEAEVRRRLEEDERVDSFEYVGQQGAYEEFQRLFSDDPALVDSVSPELLPSSFRLEVDGGSDAVAELVAAYETLPGVREVATPPSPGEVVDVEPPGDSVHVFLHPTASAEELEALADELRGGPGVASVVVTDHEQALQDFSDLFSDDAGLDDIGPGVVPPSIEVVMAPGGADRVLAAACGLAGRPIVREVVPEAPNECPQA